MLPVKRSKLDQNLEEKQVQTTNAVLLKSIERFATDLFECIADQEQGNFVCSGLSVHMILAMCALGAEGNTAKEILDALHLTKDNLSDDFKNIITQFEKVPNLELNVANRIFTDKSIVVKDSFKQDISKYFLSDVTNVDFTSEQEKAVNNINDWCAEKTKNKIREIISAGDIDSTTKMILANAVYFKASWSRRFPTVGTSNAPFFIDKATSVDVPTMHCSESFYYKDLETLDAECLSIPYKNEDYSFVIIKPKGINGLKQLQNNIQKIDLNYNDFTYDNVHLALPKFKIESQVNLDTYLSKLGMVEMFTEKANFKGISEEPELIPPLHVDKAFQKAFIEVDERGTEAYAVTYFRMRGGGAPGSPIKWRDFKVDRPFFYRIVNNRHNLTLFSGRVIKPEYN